VVVGTKAALPGVVTLSIGGKHGTYALVPGQEPLVVEVALNDTAAPSGASPGTDQCGQATFVAAPGIPSCAFNGSADKLLCH